MHVQQSFVGQLISFGLYRFSSFFSSLAVTTAYADMHGRRKASFRGDRGGLGSVRCAG